MQASHSQDSYKCSTRLSIAQLIEPNLTLVNILIQVRTTVKSNDFLYSFLQKPVQAFYDGQVAKASLWQIIQWKADRGEEYTVLFHCCPATLKGFQIKYEMNRRWEQQFPMKKSIDKHTVRESSFPYPGTSKVLPFCACVLSFLKSQHSAVILKRTATE